MSLNQVQLIGYLGNDPEMRTTQNGKQVATLSVATSYKKKEANGNYKEFTEWHNISVFNQIPFMQYLKKGDQVYIRGRLHYSQSEENGVKRYFTSILCDEIQRLNARDKAQAAPEQAQSNEEEVPF